VLVMVAVDSAFSRKELQKRRGRQSDVLSGYIWSGWVEAHPPLPPLGSSPVGYMTLPSCELPPMRTRAPDCVRARRFCR
jgi:hypothetical protein